MPFTPYHFGPCGFVSLIFYRWIDVPMFLLANVIIDIEVLFAQGMFPHRNWHFHTLIVSAAVCGMTAAVIYLIKPFRVLIKKMTAPFLPGYEPAAVPFITAAILGGLSHVLIDAIYHYDVQLFWPWLTNSRPLWRLLTQQQVKTYCLAFWVFTVILYIAILLFSYGQKIKNGNKSTA
jgi:hypothetical protein